MNHQEKAQKEASKMEPKQRNEEKTVLESYDKEFQVTNAQDSEEEEEPSTFRSYLNGIFKTLALLTLLYFFICSITFLEAAFKLVSGKQAGAIFGNKVMTNPIVGLMIGILFTVLVQSSSTCTSVIVSLVAAGGLEVKTAIPMVMGANIGTSMTSTLVSLTQVTDVVQFERAFAAATVHDCFNWLSVIVLLVVELPTDYLLRLTQFIVDAQDDGGQSQDLGIPNIFDYFVTPFTNLIIQVNDTMLECWGANEEECQNATSLLPNPPPSPFLFDIENWSDQAIGGVLLVIALFVLSLCLILIVKVLRSSLEGSVARLIKKFVNADIKYAPWLTGYLALLLGAGLTFVVQSSSVFTSTLTPLVGVGLIEVDRMYPLVLGSNIGTTSTALLAAFAAHKKDALQIALCHFFFNISGILLYYPLPFMRFPLPLCKLLGRTTARYRWFAIFYLIFMFCVLPAAVLGLSLAGTLTLAIVGIPLLVVLIGAVVINVMQAKCPKILPVFMRTWDWLPFEWMHSLDPMDKGFMVLLKYLCICCPGFYEKLQTVPSAMDNKLEGGDAITAQPVRSSVQMDGIVHTEKDGYNSSVSVEKEGYTNQTFINSH